MNLDDFDPQYDGPPATRALGELLRVGWDTPGHAQGDCEGGRRFVGLVAGLTADLESGTVGASSLRDVVALADHHQSWATYIDPALSVHMVPPIRLAIALWECPTHIAYVVQNGRGWHAVLQHSAVDQLMALAGKPRLSRAAEHDDLDPTIGTTERQEPRVVASDDGAQDDAIAQQLGDLAALWLEEGFSLSEAIPWAKQGLLPFHADRWREWPTEEAILYCLQALRPPDVIRWRQSHPDESSFLWAAAGIRLSDATDWLAHGYSLERTLEQVRRGIHTPRHVQ